MPVVHELSYGPIGRMRRNQHEPYYHSGRTGRVVLRPKNYEKYCYTEPAFYGYSATCWQRWPEGWVGCPCQESILEGPALMSAPETVDAPAEIPAAPRPTPSRPLPPLPEGAPSAPTVPSPSDIPSGSERSAPRGPMPGSLPEVPSAPDAPNPASPAVPESSQSLPRPFPFEVTLPASEPLPSMADTDPPRQDTTSIPLGEPSASGPDLELANLPLLAPMPTDNSSLLVSRPFSASSEFLAASPPAELSKVLRRTTLRGPIPQPPSATPVEKLSVNRGTGSRLILRQPSAVAVKGQLERERIRSGPADPPTVQFRATAGRDSRANTISEPRIGSSQASVQFRQVSSDSIDRNESPARITLRAYELK